MAAHKATLKIPHEINLGTTDIEVVIRKDGRKFGTVKISMGTIDWVPSGGSPRYMNWATFAALMKEEGSPNRPHT
jgi:hypothetical protein